MTTPSLRRRLLVLALPSQRALARAVCDHLTRLNPPYGGGPHEVVFGDVLMRQFPDGEHYLRLLTEGFFEQAVVVGSLHPLDASFLQLCFLAEVARDAGARRVGLVAPYLSYLRQDERFQPGELITAQSFARLLERSFDWLVTVDPHLHRLSSLSEVYTIPTFVVRAAPAIARWIGSYVTHPLIVGPDAESDQWARPIADQLGAPLMVMSKTRLGDRDVEVQTQATPSLSALACPVVVDDIISTGRTMIAAAQELQRMGIHTPPVLVGIHPVFVPDAHAQLLQLASPQTVASCNTIPHPSNAVDLSEAIAATVAQRLDDEGPAAIEQLK